jgi:hypothetical protein
VSLRPFFPYYGGKWRAALTYPAPRFETVVEPFAGSAGYSVQHHWARVVLVERDPVVASVWRYLLQATPGQLLGLPDVVADLEVEPAVAALIGFWLNPGSAYPGTKPSTWSRQWPSKWTWSRKVRERLADQVAAVRHWTLIEGEWFEGPEGEATRFVDAPYEVAGNSYRYGPEGVDFDVLATACRTWPGQTIVCENRGAAWLPFEEHAAIKSARGHSLEVVWLGGQP